MSMNEKIQNLRLALQALENNQRLSNKFANKEDSTFDIAIDYIQEAVRGNYELSIWLDRDVFTEASCCSVGIPRDIGSKNAECLLKQKIPYPKLSKREITIELLEIKLRDLVDEPFENLVIELPAFLRNKKVANESFLAFKF